MFSDEKVVPQEIFVLLQTFASLQSPRSSSLSHKLPLSYIHDCFLDLILLSPHFQQYPPSQDYQRSFWKWALEFLEQTTPDEEYSRIYDHYLSLQLASSHGTLSSEPYHGTRFARFAQPGPPSPSYITYFWPKSPAGEPTSTINLNSLDRFTLLESRTTVESGTTGLRTWLASFVLAKYLTSHPDLVTDKTVLELGSGIGFIGMIVANLQNCFSSSPSSSSLWMTDVNEDVLARCKNNVKLPCNASHNNDNIYYRFLDWSNSLDPEKIPALTALLQKEISPDVILGADIIFDPALVPALVGVLRLSLQPANAARSKTALLASTIRNKETFALFLQTLKELHLDYEELHIKEHRVIQQSLDENGGENIKILKITM